MANYTSKLIVFTQRINDSIILLYCKCGSNHMFHCTFQAYQLLEEHVYSWRIAHRIETIPWLLTYKLSLPNATFHSRLQPRSCSLEYEWLFLTLSIRHGYAQRSIKKCHQTKNCIFMGISVIRYTFYNALVCAHTPVAMKFSYAIETQSIMHKPT